MGLAGGSAASVQEEGEDTGDEITNETADADEQSTTDTEASTNASHQTRLTIDRITIDRITSDQYTVENVTIEGINISVSAAEMMFGEAHADGVTFGNVTGNGDAANETDGQAIVDNESDGALNETESGVAIDNESDGTFNGTDNESDGVFDEAENESDVAVNESANESDGAFNESDNESTGDVIVDNESDGALNETDNESTGAFNESNNESDGVFNESDNESAGAFNETDNGSDGVLNETGNESDGVFNETDNESGGDVTVGNESDGALNLTDGESDGALDETDNESEDGGSANETEGNQTQMVNPFEPAGESFEVTNLDAPETATVGDQITVTAEISNPNDFTSTQHAEFRLEGDVVERQYYTLEAGESKTVTFEVDTEGLETGDYVHGVLTMDKGEVAEISLESANETEEEAPTDEEEEVPTNESEEAPTDEEGEETEAPADEEEQEEAQPNASVTFEDQETDGSTVTVDSVNLSEGGFVTIHNSSLLGNETLSSVVGTSEYLEPGEHENVEVQLFDEEQVPGAEFSQDALEDNETLIAMPHLDTNGNETYDFVETEGAEDGPYTEDGEAVTDRANVTLADEEEEEAPTDGEDEEAQAPTDGEEEAPTNESGDAPTDGEEEAPTNESGDAPTDGEDEAAANATLGVSDQSGSGETLSITEASASEDYYIVARYNGETTQSDTFLGVEERIDYSLSLDPPIENDTTVEVAILSAEDDQELASEEIQYDVQDAEDGEQAPTNESGEAPTDGEEEAVPSNASVTFEDQETNGSTVTVQNVSVPEGGFVTIHNSSLLVGQTLDSVIGTSEYLEPGVHQNVTVQLYNETMVSGTEFSQDALERDETLIAMPHLDTNDNETYDFVETEGAEDGPYTVDDEAVTDRAELTLSAGDTEEAQPITSDGGNETGNETTDGDAVGVSGNETDAEA